MDEAFWLQDENDLETLSLTYAFLQDHFTDVYERVRDTDASIADLPGPARVAPYDIWHAVGDALRHDADQTVVFASVSAADIAGVKTRLARCVSASRTSCGSPVTALVDKMCSDSHAAPIAADDDPSPLAWRAARVPVPDLVHLRRYTTALYRDMWLAMVRGDMSRFLIATAEHEQNLIALDIDMCAAVERAVRVGSDTADLMTTSSADRFLHTVEIIERRIAMLPHATDLGISLPIDTGAFGVIERTLTEAKHNCIVQAEAAAERHP